MNDSLLNRVVLQLALQRQEVVLPSSQIQGRRDNKSQAKLSLGGHPYSVEHGMRYHLSWVEASSVLHDGHKCYRPFRGALAGL